MSGAQHKGKWRSSGSRARDFSVRSALRRLFRLKSLKGFKLPITPAERKKLGFMGDAGILKFIWKRAYDLKRAGAPGFYNFIVTQNEAN